MISLRNRPIGVFDSGVGGLTVLRSIRSQLPAEDLVYYGDTARVPYGNKSRSTIIRFSREIMDFLVKKNVKMVVVACNTASSLGLLSLRRSYAVPITGVIGPGVKEAARFSKSGRIGVIGTDSTISSGAYDRALKKTGKDYRLFSRSCPLFVPLVENRFYNDAIACQVAERYLSMLKKRRIDTLILGCTHYPILKPVIKKVMDGVRLVDSSHAVAKEIKNILHSKNMGSWRKRKGRVRCFVSDDVEGFRRMSKIFLREDIHVMKVVL